MNTSVQTKIENIETKQHLQYTTRIINQQKTSFFPIKCYDTTKKYAEIDRIE